MHTAFHFECPRPLFGQSIGQTSPGTGAPWEREGCCHRLLCLQLATEEWREALTAVGMVSSELFDVLMYNPDTEY
jgi:hypothetical protein